jgi:hypothetical protein
MRAMLLRKPKTALEWSELDDPEPSAGEIRIKVAACGVCRTDLHVVDGELPDPRLPIIPGHEIVGRVDVLGRDVRGLELGERVGIPWLGHTCGVCPYCRMQRENLCNVPLFTGYTRNGGYASAAVADARFAFPLGEQGSDTSLAPLLCAGLIGWRSLVIAGEAKRLGFYGFGAAAHILAQVARWQGRSVFAFTRGFGDPAICIESRRGLGGRVGGRAAGAARCGDYLCAGRRSGAPGFASRAQGRPGGLCGNSYERHSCVPVSVALGRTRVSLGRQSHSAGRHRFFEAGAANRHRNANHRLPARTGKRSAGRLAGRTIRRRRGARAVSARRAAVCAHFDSCLRSFCNCCRRFAGA